MTKANSQSPNPPKRPSKANKADKAAQINEHIGRELRAMFDDVVAEPVPEKFQRLLEELEKNQSKR